MEEIRTVELDLVLNHAKGEKVESRDPKIRLREMSILPGWKKLESLEETESVIKQVSRAMEDKKRNF